MKKFAGNFMPLLLAVWMICSGLPVAVFAAGETGVTETGYHEFNPNTVYDNVLDGYMADTGYGTVVLTDEVPTAVDSGIWCRYYGGHGGGAPKGYSNFTVFSTNPDVATASVEATAVGNHGAMNITFNKGNTQGTTKITVQFDIDGLIDEHGISQGDYTALWGEIVYNVTNGNGGGPAGKPDKPTDGELDSFTGTYGAVRVQCVKVQEHVGKISKPVSYTHLDVYKRQIWSFMKLPEWMEPEDGSRCGI